MPHLTPSMFQRLAGSRRRGLARLWAWGLLLALLVAPLLGVVHAVVHPQGVPVATSTSAPGAATMAPGSGSVQGQATSIGSEPGKVVHLSWLDRLFSHQAGSGDCRLFDQLCQGHALPSVPSLPVLLLPPVAVFVFLQLGRIVQREALFHARAPPALR